MHYMVCVDGVEMATFGPETHGDNAAEVAINLARSEKRGAPENLVTIVLIDDESEKEYAQGVIQVGMGV